MTTLAMNKIVSRGKKQIIRTIGKADRTLLFILLALIVFGSVMVFSASTAYSSIRFDDPYYFARKQLLWVTLGLAAMLLTSRIPLERFYRLATPLYIATLVLLLLVPIIGTEAGGAKRWIAIGSFTFQPSELAKTALILMLAHYFTKHHDRVRLPRCRRDVWLYGILFPFLLIGTVCGAVILEKHLSCIIILGLIGLSLMFLCGANSRILLSLCGGAGAAVGIFAVAVEYTRRRLIIWLNPELYPTDGGWQTLQGLMAIGSGGFFGLGLGSSRLKYLYVSEPQNDFIFTIACAFDIPSERAASICPLSTALIPLLISSAIYAPEFIPNAIIAVISVGNPLIANIT